MSHAAAQHLASYGRGGDTELVHMTKGEIKGLQALALAHGGSLTINPNTGLAEAGFLKRLLPTLAGAALAATGVGAPMAALLVGGGYGLATGSITKGLMAGLGAFGGAGLTSSLGALGAEATAAAGQQAATEGFKTIGEQAITSGLENLPVGSGGVGVPTESGMYFPGATPGAGTEVAGAAGTNYYQQAAQNYITPQNFPGLTPEQITSSQAGLPEAMRQGAAPEQYMGSLGRASAAQSGTTTGNISRGIKEVFSSPSAAGSFVKDNALTLGGALLPGIDQEQKPPAGYTEDEYDRYLKGFRMSPNYQAYEAPRPNPYYQAKYAAQGGIMQLQGGGGPVERMSMMNTAMNPQGGLYPQGMIDKTQYATPTQRPVSAEMVDEAPAYERSSPMLMAEGGQIPISLQGSVNLNPNNMASRAFSGAATSGPSMGPQGQISPGYGMQGTPQPQLAVLPRFEGSMTGGPGMGPQGQISPGGPGGIGAAQLAVLPRTMAEGGIAGILEAAKSQGYTPMEYDQIYGRGNALQDMQAAMKRAKYASGGISSLGGYSDGGRMLKGPGDGMSDSIPGVIAGKQPARLADGEFVVPADVVSHLGNGSTDAGAKRLYSMMDKVRKARTGNKKQGKQINPNRFMPA